jgi:CelD/BcsL family acetyltransferase involved in cellulose biosynthesis
MRRGNEVWEIHDIQSLEEIRPEWNELLLSCPEASIFNTWEWLSSWWGAYGANSELIVLAFPDRDGRLLALAPLCLGRKSVVPGMSLREIRLLGDGSGDSDNLALLIRPGFEEKCTNQLLDYLESNADRWHICCFNTMDKESSGARNLIESLRKKKWTVYSSFVPWSAIALPGTWELFLKSLSKKMRGELERRTRRLEKRYQVRFYKCTQLSELPRSLDALFELHTKRWNLKGERGSFAVVERRNFYKVMAARFLEKQWLEFWFLEIEKRTVACMFGFRYGQTAYGLQRGFDPEYSSEGVAQILQAYVLKRYIEGGIRRLDFLGGKNPSKERWGANVGNYVNVSFAKSLSFGSLYLNLKQGSVEAKEGLRRVMPQQAWTVMRNLNLRLHGKAPKSGVASRARKGR